MTAVRDVCTYCKADVLILRTLSGKYWPFDATFHDARLIPSGRAFGVKRREGQPTAIALDSTDTTPDGKVLTRH
jgi:hypothetical protein